MHYNNPPIVESLIDIRATLPDGATVDLFRDLGSKLSTEYPHRGELRTWEMEAKLHQGKVTPGGSALSIQGLLFDSEDKGYRAQLRVDGFTFNRLKPYTSWEDLYSRAIRIWELYAKAAKPENVTRVATRFINRFEVSGASIGEVHKFLTQVPTLMDALPPILSSYSQRFIAHGKQSEPSCNLLLSASKSPEQEDLKIVIDIDAYRLGSFGTESANLAEPFEQLHQLKNRVFEESITDLSRGLFA